MRLIGVQTGSFEGHNWAKLHITEPFNNDDGCIGEKVVSVKCDYNVALSLLGKKDILNQEIECWFDRNGRVKEINY